MKSNNKVCKRCVMDQSAAEITFDGDGNCNFCTDLLQRSGKLFNRSDLQLSDELELLASQIKSDGRRQQYDCIVGVSGGVDSSWALVKAVELGLRPLAVHMDNGWNSELAQNNIENLVKGLNVDLYTHVIDWNEYRISMQSFFDADVIDIELLYDNAMLAVNYQQASRYNVKYILSGSNQATEGMKMPAAWNWFKYDKANIKSIARFYSGESFKTFPAIGTFDYLRFRLFKKIQWVPFLDYFAFNKESALNFLENEYGYKRYPYKHYESIFTRFYQGHILPVKFGVDKRRLHLSTLIATGQLEREDAVTMLGDIPYASREALEEDKSYFLKKLKWTDKEFNEYLSRPEKSHSLYNSEKKLWDFCLRFYQKYVK
jgi:N-acetyl sugar amidotransferase